MEYCNNITVATLIQYWYNNYFITILSNKSQNIVQAKKLHYYTKNVLNLLVNSKATDDLNNMEQQRANIQSCL